MIGSLKKLEAGEGGEATLVSPAFSTTEEGVVKKPDQPLDRRQFSIPNDGWVSGPGRVPGRRTAGTRAHG